MNIAPSSKRFFALPLYLGLLFSGLAAPAQTLITPVSDFASSYYSSLQVPANLINNSGLDTSSGNVLTYTAAADGSANGMWAAGAGQNTPGNAVVANQYLVFDLGANYNLSTAYLWQMIQTDLPGRGIDQFQLYASATAPSSTDASNPPSTYDLSGFTEILNTSTLQETAPGATSTPTQSFALTGATDVRQVVLQIDNDWNGDTSDVVGLSEIKFDGTLVPANTEAWANASGGAWQTAENWSPKTVPAGNDTANFALNSTYTVNLTLSTAVGTMNVTAGSVTLNTGTNTLDATTLFVRGTNDSLVITGGGQVVTEDTSIYGASALSVSGSGTVLSASDQVDVGDGSGTGSLAISGGAKVRISLSAVPPRLPAQPPSA